MSQKALIGYLLSLLLAAPALAHDSGGGLTGTQKTGLAGVLGPNNAVIINCNGTTCTFDVDNDGTADFTMATSGLTVPRTTTPTLAFGDSDTTDSDDNAKIRVNCTATGSGAEDCDITIIQQQSGADTTVATFDASTDATAIPGLHPVEVWRTGAPNSGTITTELVDDECDCWQMPVTSNITPDQLGFTLQATSANDNIWIAIYEEDGDPQYAECEVSDTSSSSATSTKCTASGTEMPPGEYWFCLGFDDAGADGRQVAIRGIGASSSVYFVTNAVTCTNGNPPATITPTETQTATNAPAIVIIDTP